MITNKKIQHIEKRLSEIKEEKDLINKLLNGFEKWKKGAIINKLKWDMDI